MVCAQAGSATFRGVVHGRAAHAALRLQGVSAIDRYVEVHAALHEHERRINAAVEHPLMAEHELPYPISVGRLRAGEWSSQVPDRAEFEGRAGVRVGETLAQARQGVQAAVAAVGGEPVRLEWSGGQFGSAQTSQDHPFVALVRAAAGAELGGEPACAGVTYGADMRLYAERGIPCVMLGTSGLELAHAVDERVPVADVERLARILARVLLRWNDG